MKKKCFWLLLLASLFSSSVQGATKEVIESNYNGTRILITAETPMYTHKGVKGTSCLMVSTNESGKSYALILLARQNGRRYPVPVGEGTMLTTTFENKQTVALPCIKETEGSKVNIGGEIIPLSSIEAADYIDIPTIVAVYQVSDENLETLTRNVIASVTIDAASGLQEIPVESTKVSAAIKAQMMLLDDYLSSHSEMDNESGYDFMEDF